MKHVILSTKSGVQMINKYQICYRICQQIRCSLFYQVKEPLESQVYDHVKVQIRDFVEHQI